MANYGYLWISVIYGWYIMMPSWLYVGIMTICWIIPLLTCGWWFQVVSLGHLSSCEEHITFVLSKTILILTFIACRWYPWTIHWSSKVIWIWRISPRGKLLVFGWLCGQRKAVLGNHLSFVSIQDQISRKFLSVARKPWVCKHQQNIRLLWWMWVLFCDVFRSD